MRLHTLLTLGLLLAWVAGTHAQGPDFSVVNYQVGIAPRPVVIGDFNQGGRPDVAVGNANSSPRNTVSILLNHGDGTFATAVYYGIGEGIEQLSMAVVDCNEDGYPDLAVGKYNGTVVILMNNQDGTFNNPIEYPAGSSMLDIVSANLVGDSKPDLALSNNDAGTFSVLQNNGDGTFAAPEHYPVGSAPIGITAGDYDQDGYTEVAVTNSRADSITVMHNDGTGQFTIATRYPAAGWPYGIATADLDADGWLDIVVTNLAANVVSVYFNDQHGEFTRLDLHVGLKPTGITVGDITGDPKPDLVATLADADSIVILENTGDRTFAAPQDFSVDAYPVDVAMADLDSNGYADLAVNDQHAGKVSIMLNHSGVICLGDYDRDGFGDSLLFPENTRPNDNCPNVFNPDQADWNGDGIGDGCTLTDTGTNVTVQPAQNTFVTFDSVSQGGTTGVVQTSTGPIPPVNLGIVPLGDPQYVNVSVNGVQYTGSITVCVDYADSNLVGPEDSLQLLHFEHGAWTDITTSRDTVNNRICGSTTSLSPFAIAEKCCNGSTGNIDGDHRGDVNITDLAVLIDHLFISFKPLFCSTAANVDGSPNGSVDIGDITLLIDRLFINFTPLEVCQ